MEKLLFVLAALIISANGIRFIDETNRITTGTNAAEQQFPYVISLQQIQQQNQPAIHRCGGAMITLQHALTAARCLYTLDANLTITYITASQYRVYAGDNLLTGYTVAERVRSIANYTVHPEHLIYPALLNDIGVVTLATPFLNTTVVPIPLPDADFVPDDFTQCVMAGWGAPNASVVSNNALQFTSKYTYNQDRCSNLYNSFAYSINIHNSMICAASYNILSVGCTGDEGNSLVCNGQLTGLLSVTNQCLVTSYPEVYTRVSNYTTWVRSITGGASTYKPGLVLFGLITVVCAKMFR